MDFIRGSLFYVAILAMLSVLLVLSVAGLVFYRNAAESLQRRVEQLNQFGGPTRKAVRRKLRRVAEESPAALAERLGRRIDQLQQLLRERDRRYEELKAEFEDYVALTSELLGEPAGGTSGEAIGGQQAESELAERVRRATEAAQAQLQGAGQESDEADLAELTDQLRAVLEAATQVVLDVGQSALPSLLPLLESDSPAVREWAANLIDQINESSRSEPEQAGGTGSQSQQQPESTEQREPEQPDSGQAADWLELPAEPQQ